MQLRHCLIKVYPQLCEEGCSHVPVRVLQELQQAVEQEDYTKAAELRDSGCAGLLGWWHSRAEDDPVGHILRIAPDFGRYTAVKYLGPGHRRQQQQLRERLQTCSSARCLFARSLSPCRCLHNLGYWSWHDTLCQLTG